MEFEKTDHTHGDWQGDEFSHFLDGQDPLETVGRLVMLGRGAEALAQLERLDLTKLPVERQANALALKGDALTELSRYAEAHQLYLQAVDLQHEHGELQRETLIKATCSALRVLDVEGFRSLINFLNASADGEAILRYLSLETSRMASDEKCAWSFYTLGIASHKPQWLPEFTAVRQLIANGRWDEALSNLQTLLTGECLAVWLQVAELYRSMNQYHQAISVLEKALEHFPDSWRVSYALGLAWEFISREQAEGYYWRATTLYPGSCEAWLRLGFALANQALFGKAEEAAQKAIRLCTESGFPLSLRERSYAEMLLVLAQAATSMPIYSVGFWRRFFRGVKSLQMTKRFVSTFWDRVKSLRKAIEDAS
jgi:tetratricopeptide (TPR) repeat protein